MTTNSQYPNLTIWHDVFNSTAQGRRLIADHVAALTWDDLRAPASAINPPGQASDPSLDANTGHFLFSASQTNLLYIFLQMPHDFAEQTGITPHIHWIKEAAGTVLWQLDYKWYNPAGGEWPDSYTTTQTTTVITDYGEVSPAVNIGTMSFFPRIDGTGMNISSMFECKVSRIGGDASDTYGTTARFVEFDIHYQKVGHGSEAPGARDDHQREISGVAGT